MRGQRLLRRVTRGPAPSVAGSIDRAQSGLISGWLQCPRCTTSPTVVIQVDGSDVVGRLTATPRPDVPGGLGFLVRFPVGATSHRPVRVSVRCAEHLDVLLEQDVGADAWAVRALGQVEHVVWPIVSGWVALFESASSVEPLRLDIDGFPSVPVQPSIVRSDVQAFLGAEGVAGFQIDLGDVLGYAVSDGTVIRLRRGGGTLDEVRIADSPIGDGSDSCLTTFVHGAWRMDDTDDTDADLLADLLRRFRNTPAAVCTKPDWLLLLEAIGIQDQSASTRQWAEYLTAHGLDARGIASRLARRAVGDLRVPVIDPLPEDLARAALTAPANAPPLHVDERRETVLGHDVVTHTDPLWRHTREPGDEPHVCVAGLVRHKSGLGQNAAHSLTALSAAGIHACAEPFFPAPGGWNPRLAPTSGAAAALRDHTVLLHLPIDRVVQSLAAQPALLASPRVIGYYMWETEVIPRQFHRPLALVDEIWTATEFVASGFRAVTDTPVRVTGHAVDVSDVERIERSELGITDDAFVVHFSFDANSTVARKNPSAAIDAFHRAFDGDPSAVFLLKVRNMQQAEHLARSGDPHARGLMQRLHDDPAIRLVTGELSHGRSLGLIQLADCFISLHRSEGYGYAVAEAMALGTPVVATDYSGCTEFLSAQEGWPVGYELVDVLPEEYFFWEPGMQWGEADVQQAALALKAIRSGDGVRERSARATTQINAHASMDALREAYVVALSP